MFIINHRRIFYWVSSVLIAISVWSLLANGLNQGIDFKGGSLLEVSFTGNVPSTEQIQTTLANSGFTDASVRASDPGDFIIRLREVSPTEKDKIIADLGNPELKDFNIIGPVLGKEARNKSALAVLFVLLAIVLFITFVFRKVSRPISSWIYGLVAIIALAHDVIIPVGAFSILGHLYGFEVDTLFVTAVLVVLGFSVHDTIVVFDRVRENLSKDSGRKQFDQIVGESISETFTRSINTSLTTLLAILALYIWGPVSTHHFALALLIGIVAGTYSSIFIGSPLLVTIQKLQAQNASRKAQK
jgi:preprotein translocase subunit SecF